MERSCLACGRCLPRRRLLFCSAKCAAGDRAVMSLLFSAADEVDLPGPVGNPTAIGGIEPGDQLYLRQAPALVLEVLVVAKQGRGLVAAEVRHGRAGRRRPIGLTDLEGWQRYGRVDEGGAFVQEVGHGHA